MSSVVEEIREEGRVEEKTGIALQMLRMAEFSPEKIAEITWMSVDEVRKIIAQSEARHRPGAG